MYETSFFVVVQLFAVSHSLFSFNLVVQKTLKKQIMCSLSQDYQGELKIMMENRTNRPYHVWPGERVAQLCLLPHVIIEANTTKIVELPERGANGFGSTGR